MSVDMSKGIKMNQSFMQINSKRSLLELQKIKDENNNVSQANIIFSQNTEPDDQSENEEILSLQSKKFQSQQKQLFETMGGQAFDTAWLFILNTVISQFNQNTIRKIYLCPKNYKQHKIVLPIFKFSPQCKRFMNKVSKHLHSFKYKIVVDSYNASNVVEQFKNNHSVKQIYIFNDIKEEGLDQILPLKKKTNKIVGVYNSLLSLIMKCQKQMDYRVGFIEKLDNEGKQVLFPIYPNKFANALQLPYSQNINEPTNLKNIIASSIGIPIQQKKAYVQKFFTHIKNKFEDSQDLIQIIQQLQNTNHISPIISRERAQQMLKFYFGLNVKKKGDDNFTNNLFDFISESIKNSKSLKNLQLGLHQIFHCIIKLSKQAILETNDSLDQQKEHFPQNPNISTINTSKSVQIKVQIEDSIKVQSKSRTLPNEHCYKFISFPINKIKKIIGSYIEIHEFCEFYSDLKTAETNFNLNHCLKQSKTQKLQEQYFQTMYNKVCLKLKLPNRTIKSFSKQNYLVDYGIIEITKICDDLGIQVSQRWKSVCLTNIMSVFKVQKVQTMKINSKMSIQTISLCHTALQDIFYSDPNYLSMNQLKILNFYKRTNIFKALNGNYRQVARVKNNLQKTNKSVNLQILQVTDIKETQKIEIKQSGVFQKNVYLKRLPSKNNQNSSNSGSLPIQQFNLSNLNYLTDMLKDQYILTGSRHQNLKKKIARQKQNETSPEQSSYHNQKLLLLIQDLFRYQEQLFDMKLKLQDYHTCSYHIKNMETLLFKYPTLETELKQKELGITARRANVQFQKGHLAQARKCIQSLLQPLYKFIKKQQAETTSVCSRLYFKYVLCGCLQKKDGKEQLCKKVLGYITNYRSDKLDDVMNFLKNIGYLVSTEQRIRYFFGSTYSDDEDILAQVGHYLSEKLIESLEKVQTTNSHKPQTISEYYRLVGLFSPNLSTKYLYYLKAIQLLQNTEPFSLKTSQYYEQLSNNIKYRIISSKLNINKPEGFLSDYIFQANRCLQFYEKAINILQCHKDTQLSLIRNINSVIEILIALDQLELINQYSKDKLTSIMNKQTKFSISRSEFGYFYYLQSLKYGIQGNFNLSIKMVRKSLEELSNAFLKEDISTYQSILKVSCLYFSFKFQEIKLTILQGKLPENSLQDLKFLRQVYNEHYSIKSSSPQSNESEIYLKFYEIQALYWLQRKSLKHYYRFTFKEILVLNHINSKHLSKANTNHEYSYIEFNKLCILGMKFLTMPKIFVPLMKKIQLIYWTNVKAKELVLKNATGLKKDKNDSSSRIQPSFESSEHHIKIGQQVNWQKDKQVESSDWDVLYWKYYLVKGLYMKSTKQHELSLKCIKKSIVLAKKCHINNKEIELKTHSRNKEKMNKAGKATKELMKSLMKSVTKSVNKQSGAQSRYEGTNNKFESISADEEQQIKKYTIFVYQVQLKYILQVIECISSKIVLSSEAIKQCQCYISQIFGVINEMMGKRSKVQEEIQEMRFDDVIQNRIYEIGSQVINYLTASKLLKTRENKSIQEEIRFYSSRENLQLSLGEIFEPIYEGIRVRRQFEKEQEMARPEGDGQGGQKGQKRNQNKGKEPQNEKSDQVNFQDQVIYKQIQTNLKIFEQQVQEYLYSLNEQLGVYQSGQEYEEMFEKMSAIV